MTREEKDNEIDRIIRRIREEEFTLKVLLEKVKQSEEKIKIYNNQWDKIIYEFYADKKGE